MHYVILGNGGAGISALQTIRGVDTSSKITVISREPYPAYSPCSLPNLLSGDIDTPTLFRFHTQFYQELNVEFMKNKKAIKISPKEKTVTLEKGDHISYDKLLIAAGATPITPKNITGVELPGVHVMGSLDTTLGILDHLKQGASHAVIIGGGFMGIEIAVMLRKRGLSVTIVEMLPTILARMLDMDMSRKVAEILQHHAIQLVLNDRIMNINGIKHVTGVTLQNSTLSCDMVIIAIGVTPNIDLIQGSAITANQGILVDTSMQTNKPDIYAAGDIAEVREQIGGKQGSFAIWPNAIEQGRIAGLNMVGKPTPYHGAEVVNVLDIFNTPIVTMGSTLHEAEQCTILKRFTPDTSKKILIKNNRIIGLQFIGTIRNTGTFYALMKQGTNIADIQDKLLDDTFIITPESVQD